MNPPISKALFLAAILLAVLPHPSAAQYLDWKHSGSVWILTMPEGADLAAATRVKDFPLLVRLHKDVFDFSQAKSNGEDLRFSTNAGLPLPYQIDEWDPKNGIAGIWVRVPEIKGNARQEIRIHWGKADAKSESSGKSVFNQSNGYLSVWHMTDPAADAVGTLAAVDRGTASETGVIGKARRFLFGTGISCGEKIVSYPTGADAHTSEAWVRADKANGRILAWGLEKAQGKVVMQVASPPHVRLDCYFSGANVAGKSRLPMSEWTHIVHTYKQGDSRVYLNGKLDGVSTSPGAPLAIPRPAKMWIGGWYNNYNFVGALDEVRISKVTRSADWIKLQYENQKPLQTLVGPLVQAGNVFAVTPGNAVMFEGKSATFSAQAGGAQKLYWLLRKDGKETIAAVDRLTFTLDAGRVVGDQAWTLRFKAVYADRVKAQDIPIAIKENIPEPIFTLKAAANWNGREAIEVHPEFVNGAAMQTAGAGELNYAWTVSDIAVIKEVKPGKLILKRAQNSGTMTVSVAIDNGGAASVQSVKIAVKEPEKDAWVERMSSRDEMPEDNQFCARDAKDEGTLHCRGTLDEAADSVFLKVFVGDRLERHESQKLPANKSYALSAKIKAGLVKYTVEFGTKTGEHERVLHKASNIVCGDAYLINGQSNAEATDVGKEDPSFTIDWIRSFGSMAGDAKGARLNRWGNAVVRDRKGGKLQIGYWGMELAKRLVESQKMPICIINGAVGGSRIDQHQRNPADPEDVATIYGRLLWRVRHAKLTYGIRGVLWHQGENDQGADGPNGRYGWETYQQYFVDMSAGWKEDYPNLHHTYIFQIWPKACSMGIDGSDNMLREVQRTLPRLYSKMSVMSTLGIQPPGGCHFPPAGYAEFARLICPLVERHNYGKSFPGPITPANLKAAYYYADRTGILLEFDQPMAWNDSLASQFYLDGEKGKIEAGALNGNRITLKLTAVSAARNITYLDSKTWSQKNLLYGKNGIAALTFCRVRILESIQSR